MATIESNDYDVDLFLSPPSNSNNIDDDDDDRNLYIWFTWFNRNEYSSYILFSLITLCILHISQICVRDCVRQVLGSLIIYFINNKKQMTKRHITIIRMIHCHHQFFFYIFFSITHLYISVLLFLYIYFLMLLLLLFQFLIVILLLLSLIVGEKDWKKESIRNQRRVSETAAHR